MDIRKRVAKLMAVWGLAVALAVLPGATLAHSSVWHGDDQAFDDYDAEFVCDGEDDGNYAYANYGLSNGVDDRVDDLDGKGDWCYGKRHSGLRVVDHRVCENINNWPDACSNWQPTGH